MVVTICYVDEKPIVYKGEVSEEDKEKIKALFPGSNIRWEVKRIK